MAVKITDIVLGSLLAELNEVQEKLNALGIKQSSDVGDNSDSPQNKTTMVARSIMLQLKKDLKRGLEEYGFLG